MKKGKKEIFIKNRVKALTLHNPPHLFTASHTFWNPPFLMINLARNKKCCQPFCYVCEPYSSHQTRVTRHRSQTREKRISRILRFLGPGLTACQGSNPPSDRANWLQTSDKFWRISFNLFPETRGFFWGGAGEIWSVARVEKTVFSQNNRNPCPFIFSILLWRVLNEGGSPLISPRSSLPRDSSGDKFKFKGNIRETIKCLAPAPATPLLHCTVHYTITAAAVVHYKWSELN